MSKTDDKATETKAKEEAKPAEKKKRAKRYINVHQGAIFVPRRVEPKGEFMSDESTPEAIAQFKKLDYIR